MKVLKKFFIQKVHHCPDNPKPIDLMQQKWYPGWTRFNGYIKLEDATKALTSILKKDYCYDKDCSFRVVDRYGKVLTEMTLNELIKNGQRFVDEGYGDKEIVVENGEMELEIDSIQSNSNPGIEPDYLFIMGAGEFQSVLDNEAINE